MRTHTTRRSGEARGQSVAELALILPALLLLLLSILQIGFLIFTQLGLTNAAREASRNAASIPVARVRSTHPADGGLTLDLIAEPMVDSDRLAYITVLLWEGAP